MNTTMTRHEELSSIYSDMYKDTHGFRPRHIDFSKMTVEDLEKELDLLQIDLDRSIAAEKEEQERAKVKFEATVVNLIKTGAKDRRTALDWLHEACNANGDWSYVEYEHNLPYGYLADFRGNLKDPQVNG